MEDVIDELDAKIDEVHKTLSNTSIELSSLFWGVEQEVLMRRSAENEWCALEILIHLKQVAEVFASRVKRIMKRETDSEPLYFKDFDEHKLLAKVKLDQENVKTNLSEFMQARSELLNLVSLIDKSEWKKKVAKHQAQGELTLLELLIPLAERELSFLNRLQELIDPTIEEEPIPEHTIDSIHKIITNSTIELNQLYWGVPIDDLQKPIDGSEWNAFELLIHLRQVGEVYAERVKRAMKVEEGQLISVSDFDEHKQMSKIKLGDESVRGNLSRFMECRSKLLNKISLIDKDLWDVKRVKHETSGELNLLELLIPLAQRELKIIDTLKVALADYY